MKLSTSLLAVIVGVAAFVGSNPVAAANSTCTSYTLGAESATEWTVSCGAKTVATFDPKLLESITFNDEPLGGDGAFTLKPPEAPQPTAVVFPKANVTLNALKSSVLKKLNFIISSRSTVETSVTMKEDTFEGLDGLAELVVGSPGIFGGDLDVQLPSKPLRIPASLSELNWAKVQATIVDFVVAGGKANMSRLILIGNKMSIGKIPSAVFNSPNLEKFMLNAKVAKQTMSQKQFDRFKFFVDKGYGEADVESFTGECAGGTKETLKKYLICVVPKGDDDDLVAAAALPTSKPPPEAPDSTMSKSEKKDLEKLIKGASAASRPFLLPVFTMAAAAAMIVLVVA